MVSSIFPTVEKTVRSLFRGGQRSASPAAIDLKLRFLREVDILRDLNTEEMDWLKHSTEMVTCEPGRMIYGQDEQVEVLFILKKGKVQLYRLTPEGKKLELATVGAGTFFGEMPFLGQRMHNAFAEAIEESVICVMSREDVERLIDRKPQVAVRMLEVLSARLGETESRLEALAFQNVPARLAAALLQLAPDDELRMSHQELGDRIGAYRETVTKTLDEFQRAGLVELGRMRIAIRDRNGLQRVAGRVPD
jgi:CRP/FNR family transcriptional regulator, cyclic AMP receptor protein